MMPLLPTPGKAWHGTEAPNILQISGSKSFISRSVAAKEPWSGTFKALSDRTPRFWTQDRKCFTRETDRKSVV